MKNFSFWGIDPSDFNVVIRPLGELQQKKSDSNNGYYIVADTWGTCFFRISNTRKEFDICANMAGIARTYTKIPVALMPNVYFVYVNYMVGDTFLVRLPNGGRIVGMHDHTPSADGKWFNSSFLVYSPTGAEPSVERSTEYDGWQDELKLVDAFGSVRSFDIGSIMRKKQVRRLYINEDGFVITTHNCENAPITDPGAARRGGGAGRNSGRR
jgi:hypothetical protein